MPILKNPLGSHSHSASLIFSLPVRPRSCLMSAWTDKSLHIGSFQVRCYLLPYIVPSQIKTLFCSATSMWHSRHSRLTKVGFRSAFRRLLFIFAAMLPPRALTTHLHASILTPHRHFSTMFPPPFNCLLLRPCHCLLPRVQVKCYVWPAEWELLPWKCWGIIEEEWALVPLDALRWLCCDNTETIDLIPTLRRTVCDWSGCEPTRLANQMTALLRLLLRVRHPLCV